MENKTQKLFNIKYGVKHSKTWKMRNTGYSTRNMARKLKNEENKHTLQNLECGEKTEKRGK